MQTHEELVETLMQRPGVLAELELLEREGFAAPQKVVDADSALPFS